MFWSLIMFGMLAMIILFFGLAGLALLLLLLPAATRQSLLIGFKSNCTAIGKALVNARRLIQR